MQKLGVIVLGSDENAYECARAIHTTCGTKPVVLGSSFESCLAHSSVLSLKAINDIEQSSVFKSTVLRTVNHLLKKNEHIIVIPCSHTYARLLSECRIPLLHRISNQIITPRWLDRVQNKKSLYEMCEECNVLHESSVICGISELFSNTKELEYPLTLGRDNEYDGIERYEIKSSNELYSRLSDISVSGHTGGVWLTECSVNEDCEYALINAYCDADSKVRIVGAMRPLVRYTKKRSVGGYAALEAVREKELCDSVADFFEKAGCVGFVSAEIRNTSGDKEWRLNSLSCFYHSYFDAEYILHMYEDAVLKKPYLKRAYADRCFVWLNEPVFIIRREMKIKNLCGVETLSLLPHRSTLRLRGDMGVARALSLLRAYLDRYSKKI